jgi:hypothetical protein
MMSLQNDGITSEDKPHFTILTIPRGFKGDTGRRQRNAIGSWLALDPKPEVILFGDDPGVAEAAAEFGIEHVPKIERTPRGTPFLREALLMGQKYASNDIIAYINPDILILDGFGAAIAKIQKMNWSRYLLIGQRWDWVFDETIDFSKPQWRSDLRNRVKNEGSLQLPAAKDYFVFPRGTYKRVPFLAIGRMVSDDWMVSNILMKGLPVVDLTEDVLVVHQNHDYSHILNDSKDDFEELPEVKYNRSLADPYTALFNTTADATWVLKDGLLRRRFSLEGILLNLCLHFKNRQVYSFQFEIAKLWEMLTNK